MGFLKTTDSKLTKKRPIVYESLACFVRSYGENTEVEASD